MDQSDRSALGQALIVGSVLFGVAGVLTPGRLLIDPTPRFNMVDTLQVLKDNTFLTHFSTVMAIFGFGVILYALIKLWPVSQSVHGRLRVIFQIGLTFTAVYFVSLLFERGIYNVALQVTDHGVGGGVREQVVGILALGVQTTGLILRYVGDTLGLCGTALLAWGVSTLFDGGFFKIASVVMALYSVFGFLAMMVAEHVQGFDLAPLGVIYASVRILFTLWFLLLGTAIYRGKTDLSPA